MNVLLCVVNYGHVFLNVESCTDSIYIPVVLDRCMEKAFYEL